LAASDAELILLVNIMNKNLGREKVKVLGGNAYLVTESSHYRKAGQILGTSESLAAAANSLRALAETVGARKLSDGETVLLFENPFLGYSVEAVWKDVETLVRAGVSTAGKRMARLGRDLDEGFRKYISVPDEAAPPRSAEAEMEGLLEMVTSARAKGYELVPDVEKVADLYTKAKETAREESADNKRLKEQLEIVGAKIEEFGKRKRRYPRKFTK